MNDGYDLYCTMKLESVESSNNEHDDILCACADYLKAEGYGYWTDEKLNLHTMAVAAQLIPTTTNQRR